MPFEPNERQKKLFISLLFLIITLIWKPSSKKLKYKIFFFGFTISYIFSNFLTLMGFGAPSLPEHHYHPDFIQLRKFLTGLDAGIVSCIHVKPIWLRQTIQIILGAYFILFPQKAEDRMLRFHQNPTIEGIRLCWEKGRHPLLWSVAQLQDPIKLKYHRKLIKIMRENDGTIINTYLYFQGTLNELKYSKNIIINYPGGGFVAMNHLHHETYIRKWANYLRVPIISVNYRKAPEYQYPNGFNDAYDVYKSVVKSKGKCLGINVDNVNIKIALTGDSAGGNFVAGVCCKAIVDGIKIPDGLLMAYPCLDLDLSLFRAGDELKDFTRNMTNAITRNSHTPADVVVRKDLYENEFYNKIITDPIISKKLIINKDNYKFNEIQDITKRLKGFDKMLEKEQPGPLSSRIMYFNDGVLPIKYMLSLGDAYLPTHADPRHDMFLSPIYASDEVLKKFPLTRIHCGSVDPLIDDSRRFVKRLKYANKNIDVKLFEWKGVSHAYIQSPTFLLSQAKYSCEIAVAWLSAMLNVDVKGKENFEYDGDSNNDDGEFFDNAKIMNQMMQQSKL